MKEQRPILFSAPMVRAILAGTKTQTRRVVKPQPVELPDFNRGRMSYNARGNVYRAWNPAVMDPSCPYGQTGDRLWVRETFMDLLGTGVEHRPDPRGPLQRYAYAADHQPGSFGDEARKSYGLKWKPSIHMPRRASRITLEITGVRVERLQDISDTDAIAEGIVECSIPADDEGPQRIGYMVGPDDGKSGLSVSPIKPYRNLWESINGASSWEVNPWVWVVEFKRVEGGAA